MRVWLCLHGLLLTPVPPQSIGHPAQAYLAPRPAGRSRPTSTTRRILLRKRKQVLLGRIPLLEEIRLNTAKARSAGPTDWLRIGSVESGATQETPAPRLRTSEGGAYRRSTFPAVRCAFRVGVAVLCRHVRLSDHHRGPSRARWDSAEAPSLPEPTGHAVASSHSTRVNIRQELERSTARRPARARQRHGGHAAAAASPLPTPAPRPGHGGPGSRASSPQPTLEGTGASSRRRPATGLDCVQPGKPTQACARPAPSRASRR